MKKTIKIGTRGSQLALWQANWVKSELEKKDAGFVVEIIKIKTTGDKILDVPLAKVGGKGLFVKEIEEALLRGDIDMAVHSMKDVPTDLPKELHLSAITEREDPRDALISKDKRPFNELPERAKIGTSSLRRQAQLLHIRPDFRIQQLRGNLDTRIRKLTTEDLDAIIVAAAGVRRMGWADKITEYLSIDDSLPAIGQGALGIECRIDDKEINNLLEPFNHLETSICVKAERAFLKKLEGGCQVPIAAYGIIKDKNISLTGLVAGIDGVEMHKEKIEGKLEDAEKIGIELAEKLLSRGADRILKEVYGRI
ncbi:MAG: hydroxymethylbilane synthase [Nitrospirota bacterium]